MLLAHLASASRAVATTSSRSGKLAILAEVVAAAPPDEVEAVVAFLAGEPRQGRLGVGHASVLGIEVEAATEPTLQVAEVDRAFGRIPSLVGAGSQRARRSLLEGLLGRATRDEQELIRRLLTGDVRQGALEGLMVEAVARAAELPGSLVRRAVMLHGDLPSVARMALVEGAEAVRAVGLHLLRPVRPMLAATAPDLESALSTAGPASVEWKLDGARVQVHRLGTRIRLFSRNLNDVTDRLPEVVEAVRSLPVDRFVLDGEAMAVDGEGLPRPFGETMSRFGADQPEGEVVVAPFFFDLLHLEGEDLVDRPLGERLDLLDQVVPAEMRVPRMVGSDPGEAASFLAAARLRRHEGVMVKSLSSVYEAGSRGSAWFKVKPAHTLDLVVLAAEWGHGRRTGRLSNLHLGARDGDGGGFVMLGKTFKGLTDRMLEWQTDRLLQLEERRTGHVVWVRPELVVEVAFDGVVPSPRYPAGMALRFARVKRHRPDKSAGDADTVEAVRAVFEGRAPEAG